MEDPECLKLFGYRKRTEKEIIGVESDYMKALPPGHFRSLAAVYCSRRFRHLGALYYENKEECGEENHMGYVSLWSTLAVVVSSCQISAMIPSSIVTCFEVCSKLRGLPLSDHLFLNHF